MHSVQVTTRFRDHPPGLFYLFFAEMWERFSYYGLRAMLVLYMTSELLYADEKSYGIYATYTALVYTTPIIGGILADQILGKRRAIILGGILIGLGHLVLAIPTHDLFFYGLAFIISGTGLFKANISALLGQLYHHGDPRRDAGFTLFYVGINVGSFIAPLICGTVGELYGWHYGFGLAAIGMLTGLITFYRGLDALEGKGVPPEDSIATHKPIPGLSWQSIIYLLVFIAVPFLAFMLRNHQFFDNIIYVVGVGIVIYLVYLAFTYHDYERKAILTILVMLFFFTMFFALFEQVGGALNLFTKRIVNREFMGWEIPTTWFQALNPLFVIALGPLFAQVWVKLGAAKKEPYTPFKFFLGLLQPSLGFAALAYGASCCTETGLVSIWWLVLAYFLFTTGELCISPVGLAMVTKLAPQKLTGTLMGIWMIGLAYGNYLAGVMSKLASIETQVEDVPADPIGVDGDIPGAVLPDVSIPDIVAQATIYSDAFTTVMYIGLAASVLMLLIVPLLNPVFKREEKMKD